MIIQDETDKYFIPYDCKFRIRDLESTTEESDNLIYPHFSPDMRGVFIDVYAMAHPLVNTEKEKLYRQQFRTLCEEMKNLEKEIYRDTAPYHVKNICPDRRKRLESNLKKYYSMKTKYLEMERKYMSEKKDTTKYGFAPSYACDSPNLPYYDVSKTFNGKTEKWKNLTLCMPADEEEIVRGFYGDNWKTPVVDYKTKLKHIRTYNSKK